MKVYRSHQYSSRGLIRSHPSPPSSPSAFSFSVSVIPLLHCLLLTRPFHLSLLRSCHPITLFSPIFRCLSVIFLHGGIVFHTLAVCSYFFVWFICLYNYQELTCNNIPMYQQSTESVEPHLHSETGVPERRTMGPEGHHFYLFKAMLPLFQNRLCLADDVTWDALHPRSVHISVVIFRTALMGLCSAGEVAKLYLYTHLSDHIISFTLHVGLNAAIMNRFIRSSDYV